MSTLETLGGIQIERASVFPEKFADNPFRAVALDSLQKRNAALHAVFYDVDVVTPAETPELVFWLAREGAIVVVPPTGKGTLKLYPDIDGFFAADVAVEALAVAGVGSSALGAAAFARNISDALGEPVAAVVSGYGLADVLTEALGGFFFFGGLNSLRHAFEPLDTVSKLFTVSEKPLEFADGVAWARTSKDTQTVHALLTDERFRPRFLIGHSKGNLVISEALYMIASEKEALAKRLAKRARIVTFSAKIGMPKPFSDVIDVMGAWDWFGALNSRPDIPADIVVPHGWHSTNPDFPMGMGIRVTEVMKTVMARSAPIDAGPAPFTGAMLDLPQRMTAALHGHVV